MTAVAAPGPPVAAGPGAAETEVVGVVLPGPRFPAIGWVGAALVAFFAGVALAGPWIAPFEPEALAAGGLERPSWDHLLGTTPIGQDLFSQLVMGARASLLMAALAGVGAVAVGTAVGVAAGWVGGLVDALLMRLVDIILAFPRLPLLMLLGAYLGGSIPVVAAVISLLFWPGTARVVRAQVQSLRRHVAPDLALLLVAALVGAAGRAIILEAGLAFLGLGDPARTSWGSMIREARAVGGIFYTNLWVWWMLPPVLAIMAVMLGMTFLGVGFERRLNPRLARHVGTGR